MIQVSRPSTRVQSAGSRHTPSIHAEDRTIEADLKCENTSPPFLQPDTLPKPSTPTNSQKIKLEFAVLSSGSGDGGGWGWGLQQSPPKLPFCLPSLLPFSLSFRTLRCLPRPTETYRPRSSDHSAGPLPTRVVGLRLVLGSRTCRLCPHRLLLHKRTSEGFGVWCGAGRCSAVERSGVE